MNRLLFSVALILSCTWMSNAQYGGYGGVDRRIGGPGQFRESKGKDKKSEFDFVQASTDKMAKDLSLDDFQKAAVKNLIEDYKNQVNSISAEEIPDNGKMDKMAVAKDKLETKIKQLLNKDQLVKFEELKNKARKKGKHDKQEASENLTDLPETTPAEPKN